MKQEEAIKILKDFHDESALFSVRTALETLYPEFKESEDEKIIKILQEGVNDVLQDQFCTNRGVSKEKVLSWLEKQGEQKVSYTTTVETGNGGINALITKELSTNGYDGQKTAWSEEDERTIKEIDEIIYECPYCESKEEISNWLKSLKQRIGG